MLWWFLILAAGAAAILWASIAIYLQVRRHLKASHEESKGRLDKVELEAKQSTENGR